MNSAIGGVLALLFNGFTWATPVSLARSDDEGCGSVTAEKQAGAWLFVGGCSGGQCSASEACAQRSGGSSGRKFCGCEDPGNPGGDEPECCHIVLISTNGGPWLPTAQGKCSQDQAGCPTGNLCMMLGGGLGDTTAARNCKSVSPPPPPPH
jgi:hypothetical protein